MRRILLLVLVSIALTEAGLAFAQTNVLALDEQTRSLIGGLSEDKWLKRDNFMSALLGGALAFAGGIIVSWYAHRLQAKHKREEDAEFARNVVRAIRRELEALGAIYAKGIGEHLGKIVEGQILETRLALTEDWFTVFAANAAHLGRIDSEISRRIVTIYALQKSLIEEYRINNEYLTEWGEAELMSKAVGGHSVHNARRDQIHQQLVFQSISIKKGDATLQTAVTELYALLDQRGIR